MNLLNGGEGGIRTLGTLPYTHFPGVLLRPLGHLTTFDTTNQRMMSDYREERRNLYEEKVKSKPSIYLA